jgi:hypothetical protein
MKVVFNDDFIAQHGQPVIIPIHRDGMHKDVIEQIMKIPIKWCIVATQLHKLEI